MSDPSPRSSRRAPARRTDPGDTRGTRGASAARGGQGGGNEPPVWDLGDLYPGPDSTELRRDLEEIARQATSFSRRYRGRVAGLDAAELATAFDELERVAETMSRLGSYAQLRAAEDVTDGARTAFKDRISAAIRAAGQDLVFFDLEIGRMDAATAQARQDDPAMARWAPIFRQTRAGVTHQMSEELERLSADYQPLASSRLLDLHQKAWSGIRVEVAGQTLTADQARARMGARNPKLRRAAQKGLAEAYERHAPLFAWIMNSRAAGWRVDEQWRGFGHATAPRNHANDVEDEVVDALHKAVKDAYPRLAHRYYALKARWTGKRVLDSVNRAAPLRAAKGVDSQDWSWSAARDTVLAAYRDFDPRMADTAQKFFDRGWIHARPSQAKRTGAFSHSAVPSAHPYVFMSFQGRQGDVKTLAHELGHGVHQYVAGRKQGHMKAGTPLTLAETASVFGEMLTFKRMLAQETDPLRRQALVAGKVEEMLGTAVRQIAYFDFEKKVHEQRAKQGDLSADQMRTLFHRSMKEAFGPQSRISAADSHGWMPVFHFVKAPFYVYAYSFGECLVNALYKEYEQSPDKQAFADKYMEMLEAGGTRHHSELLAPFGLDARDPDFWKKGLAVIEELIDELEAGPDLDLTHVASGRPTLPKSERPRPPRAKAEPGAETGVEPGAEPKAGQ